jgi:hypothetical protein
MRFCRQVPGKFSTANRPLLCMKHSGNSRGFAMWPLRRLASAARRNSGGPVGEAGRGQAEGGPGSPRLASRAYSGGGDAGWDCAAEPGRRRPPGARLRRCDSLVGKVSGSVSYPRCKRRWRALQLGIVAGRPWCSPRRPLMAPADGSTHREVVVLGCVSQGATSPL